MKNRTATLRSGILIAALALAGVGLIGCATLDESAPTLAGNDLQSAITQRLSMDPITSGTLYGVEVVDGEVVIRGAVRSAAERMRVLGLVRGTPGVTSVSDRLRLVP